MWTPGAGAECGDEWTVECAAGPRRVLVTGSRTWTDTAAIRDALAAVWGDGTAVAGWSGTPRPGTGTDGLPDSGATPRWWPPGLTCASRSSGTGPAARTTPRSWRRPRGSPPAVTSAETARIVGRLDASEGPDPQVEGGRALRVSRCAGREPLRRRDRPFGSVGQQRLPGGSDRPGGSSLARPVGIWRDRGQQHGELVALSDRQRRSPVHDRGDVALQVRAAATRGPSRTVHRRRGHGRNAASRRPCGTPRRT